MGGDPEIGRNGNAGPPFVDRRFNEPTLESINGGEKHGKETPEPGVCYRTTVMRSTCVTPAAWSRTKYIPGATS